MAINKNLRLCHEDYLPVYVLSLQSELLSKTGTKFIFVVGNCTRYFQDLKSEGNSIAIYSKTRTDLLKYLLIFLVKPKPDGIIMHDVFIVKMGVNNELHQKLDKHCAPRFWINMPWWYFKVVCASYFLAEIFSAEIPHLYNFCPHDSPFKTCYNSYGISVIHLENDKEAIRCPTSKCHKGISHINHVQ